MYMRLLLCLNTSISFVNNLKANCWFSLGTRRRSIFSMHVFPRIEHILENRISYLMRITNVRTNWITFRLFFMPFQGCCSKIKSFFILAKSIIIIAFFQILTLRKTRNAAYRLINDKLFQQNYFRFEMKFIDWGFLFMRIITHGKKRSYISCE